MPDLNPTVSAIERVDAACDRFEADWRAGRDPRVEDFLTAAPAADRDALRSALVAVEAELRDGTRDTSVTGDSLRTDPGPADTVIPTRVGRFEVRGVLGAGAFGRVYQAFDPQLGREVAVKVPLAAAVATPAERARFLTEARSAATINHPNVCQIHEVGEDAGRPYIVMALVPGQSLADTLKARTTPLPEKQAALIARKIALALAAAHDKGIVHRDLKPANVMFDRERKDVVVMDFGLARGPVVGDARGTQSGVIMGTPAYMSPEQARGAAKVVGPTGDVFSLGVILYELLTGTRPFTGTATEVLGQILHVEPEPPSRRRPGLDARLEAACLKAMAKDPAARFASMKEFAAALETVVRAPAPAAETVRPDQTRPADPGASTNMADVFALLSMDRRQMRHETAAVVEAAIQKHRTPRRVVVAGLVAAVGLIVAAGIVFFTRSDKVKVDLAVFINDVDLKDQTLSFFLDDKPVAADELAKPVELKPGEHVFTVRRDKVIVKRMLFTVKGGKSAGIEVKDITPPPPPPPAPAGDPDREAAEKVIALGGSVSLHGNNSGKFYDKRNPLPAGPAAPHWIKLPEIAPPLADWRVLTRATDLQTLEVEVIPAGGWKDLERLTALRKFSTRSPDATPADLASLGALAELRSLLIHSWRLTDEGLVALDRLTHLDAVNLSWTAVGDATLARLARFRLRELFLHSTRVTDAGMAHVAKLDGLAWLVLKDTAVGDAGLKALAGLTALRTLDLEQTRVTPAAVAEFRRAHPDCKVFFDPADPDQAAAEWVLGQGGVVRVAPPDRLPETLPEYLATPLITKAADLPATPFRLTGIETHGRPFTDADVKRFEGMTTLRLVWLDGTRMTDAGVKMFAAARGLRSLKLENSTGITDAALKTVGAFPKLEEFRVVDTAGVTDAGLADLAGLTRLTSLGVGPKVSGAGLRALAGLTNLTTVQLDGPGITDAGLMALRELPNVFHLSVTRADAVTNDGLKPLAGMTRLGLLDLGGARLTDGALAHLKGLDRLYGLNVQILGLTDAGLLHLAGLLRLERLEVYNARLTGSGFKHLTKTARLNHLGVAGCPVTDDGLAALPPFAELRVLSLSQTRVTDKSVPALLKYPTLKVLNVAETGVTADGLKKLKAGLPGCRVLPEATD